MTESRSISLARGIFAGAGYWGVFILIPMFLRETDFSPSFTHPEFYYGFLAVALAWQVCFLLISKDPIRYRPIMIAACLEKFGYGFASLVLYLNNRLIWSGPFLGAVIDLVLGCLFVLAYFKTKPSQ